MKCPWCQTTLVIVRQQQQPVCECVQGFGTQTVEQLRCEECDTEGTPEWWELKQRDMRGVPKGDR